MIWTGPGKGGGKGVTSLFCKDKKGKKAVLLAWLIKTNEPLKPYVSLNQHTISSDATLAFLHQRAAQGPSNDTPVWVTQNFSIK